MKHNRAPTDEFLTACLQGFANLNSLPLAFINIPHLASYGQEQDHLKDKNWKINRDKQRSIAGTITPCRLITQKMI